MRVLLVEDAPRLQYSIAQALRKAGYAADVASNGSDGLWMAETHDYDTIILDLMLPQIDGLTVLRRLREKGRNHPVLILTAKDTVPDRVRGLQMGADDYLIKPFALEELLARVQALCRRSYGHKDSRIVIGDLEIDTAAKTVRRAGQPVELARREYALLEYLALRRGEVVSRTEIEAHLYDSEVEPFANVVDSAICVLRKKICPDDAPQIISTRRGLGYVIESP